MLFAPQERKSKSHMEQLDQPVPGPAYSNARKMKKS